MLIGSYDSARVVANLDEAWALLPYGASHDTGLKPGSMKHSDSISDDDGSRPTPTI